MNRLLQSTLRATTPLKRYGGLNLVRTLSSAVPVVDNIVIGGGPIGTSSAFFLAEHYEETGSDKKVMLVHDPKNPGAHEDWSRLARLSFDAPLWEYEASQNAVDLLHLVQEIRSYQSGAPVLPISPGMLFLASPGTRMAETCAHGETFGDSEYVRRDPSELDALYPGNHFTLPPDTLCWTHPTGICVSPIELCNTLRKMGEGSGVDVREGKAQVDLADNGMVRVTLANGEQYDTPQLMLFAGAQGRQILADAVARDPKNEAINIPEFEHTFITAISTVRYKHKNHPAEPKEGSGHVVPPIILGQLEVFIYFSCLYLNHLGPNHCQIAKLTD